jgi:glycosyltransferase involved in cell wall biosynthesis
MVRFLRVRNRLAVTVEFVTVPPADARSVPELDRIGGSADSAVFSAKFPWFQAFLACSSSRTPAYTAAESHGTKVESGLTFVMVDRPEVETASLLFVPGYGPGASFVAADREALAARIRLVEIVPRGRWGLAAFARDVTREIRRRRATGAVLWFAAPTYGAITAAACREFGVPLLVVSGGFDVARDPVLGFGAAVGGWRSRAVRLVLESATDVWAFSDAARRAITSLATPRRLAVVAPAVDTAFFRPPVAPARERLVVSTCAGISPVSLRQKGVDRLVAAARRLPDVEFVITGRLDASACVRSWAAAVPANVTLAGYVSREALRRLYARAAAAAQLSRHEGFGVAAVEAAAMGCQLVTTRLPVFAEVLGPQPFTVECDATDDEIAGCVAAALAADPPLPRWDELDRRYGVAVRSAAWDAWLARQRGRRGGESTR